MVKSYVPDGHSFPGWVHQEEGAQDGKQVCVAEPRSSNGTKKADRIWNRQKTQASLLCTMCIEDIGSVVLETELAALTAAGPVT